MEMPRDFRKRNAGLVFYLMAEGGIEDKKKREKEKDYIAVKMLLASEGKIACGLGGNTSVFWICVKEC